MEWILLIFVIPYVFILANIFLQLKKIQPCNHSDNAGEFISVIVPCRNAAEHLPGFIKCIRNQNYDSDLFELIIIDDNSDDPSYIPDSEHSSLKNLKVLKNEGRGKKKAIMTGVSASAGSYIITTDADCLPGEKWLSTIAASIQDSRPDMLICPVMLESKPGFFNIFQELEFLGLQGITAGTAVAKRPVMCNGANLVFKKETYLVNVNNLHPEILSGDDIFLLHSLKKNHNNNIKWLESEDTVMITASSATFKDYINQRNRWISKAGAYSDRDTIILGLVTFIAVLTQIVTLLTGIFRPELLLVFAATVLLKSFPDYLILGNTCKRYGKAQLMKWFLPCQLIYPFYVAAVVVRSVFPGSDWNKATH
jgi:glycosyltransferase involved in cell wall biosynthesis